MHDRTFLASQESSTRALGAALGRAVAPGTVVLLGGRLGAGKTTFAQGMAAGLGIDEDVVSPSFTLVREYDGRGGRPGMVHMDFYRLTNADEVRHLGIDDFLDSDAVKVIEWPERGEGALGDDGLAVMILHDATAESEMRTIEMSATGRLAVAALHALVTPGGVAEVAR
jgi:tRNA threonylcarbamoyladenosine biosynthesis protein TsaE